MPTTPTVSEIERIAPEHEYATGRIDAEQMNIGREKSHQLVGITAHEEPDRQLA
jgi:hypothetical protein